MPLLFFDPSGKLPPRVSRRIAQQVDILPSVVDCMGLDTPAAELLPFGHSVFDTASQGLAINREPGETWMASEGRFVRVRDGGVAYSAAGAINLWANVPLCPNQWASRDAFGQTFRLDVTLKERGGRQQERSYDVVPFCGDPAVTDCLCICRGGYMLGMSCAAGDAGPGPSPDDGGTAAGDAG